MLPNKKFLIIGLGSMGQRRIDNLIANGIKKSQIFGFDKLPTRAHEVAQKLKIKTFSDFKIAYQSINPNILIISTPPDQHDFYFLKAAHDQKHFFVETGTSDNGYRKLISLLKPTFVAAPSHTFHFYPAIQKIKKIINKGTIGRPLYYSFHSGQYILNWQRPWEKPLHGWFSQKNTGAGREMFIFQLRWLNELVDSFPKSIHGFIGKFSGLPIGAKDIYSAIVEYPNKVIGNIVVDVLTRKPEVILKLTGTKGNIEWSWQDFQIKVNTLKSSKIIPIKKSYRRHGYIATEEMYNNEIKEFLLSIKNKKSPFYTFEDDWRLIKILHTLEKNAHKKNR